MDEDISIIQMFLEAYVGIISDKVASKYKFKANITAKYLEHKLKKIVNKLYKSNTPLNAINVYDLVSGVYNTFIPTGKYKYFESIKYYEKSNEYQATIYNSEYYRATIIIKTGEKKFELRTNFLHKCKYSSYIADFTELSSDDSDIKKIISKINEDLTNTMADYILYVIDGAKDDEKEN